MVSTVFFARTTAKQASISKKNSEILLDLSRTPGADSQVLQRVGAKYKSTSRGSQQIGSPTPVCHKGCVHPIATGAGEDCRRPSPSYSTAHSHEKSVDGVQPG